MVSRRMILLLILALLLTSLVPAGAAARPARPNRSPAPADLPVLADRALAPAGQTTTQGLTLTAQPSYVLSGTVSDGTAGWPLYANLQIHGDPVDPPQTSLWTDPASGFYSVTLAGEVTYTLQVAAWNKGYRPASRTVGPLVGNEWHDFALQASLTDCVAPGYRPALPYYQDFESGPGGFTISGTTSWAWGRPTSGPGGAHSGETAWATNLSGSHGRDEDGFLVSPAIDLSAYAGQSIYLSWWQWLATSPYSGWASLEVSRDGGGTWERVYGEESGDVDLTWTRHGLLLDPSYAVSAFRLRFRLRTGWGDPAPGYYVDDVGILPVAAAAAYGEDFEAGNGGFSVEGATSWEWGSPTSGPGSAHSGSSAWATNLSGDYGSGEDGYAISPVVDLSAYGGQSVYLSWWQWLQSEMYCDYASVEASSDGGASWTTVYSPTSGDVDLVWARRAVELDPGWATGGFRLRFHLTSDYTVTFPGYYVEDVAIAAAPPITIGCGLQPGGLVWGRVYDGNDGRPLAGAWVRSDAGSQAVARPTPGDPAMDDAFYALFAPAGLRVLTATMTGGYLPAAVSLTVIPSTTLEHDFSLAAGLLGVAPTALEVPLDMGLSTTVPLTLSNAGGAAVEVVVQEQDWSRRPAEGPLPGAVNFSAPAPVGPLSVRSMEGRAALWGIQATDVLSWTAGSPVPGGLARYAAAQCPGDTRFFYLISGVDSTFSVVRNSWRYDALAGTWTPLAQIPSGQEGPAAVCYEGRLYVLGGGGSDQFYIYDLTAGTWAAGPPLPRGVWGAAAAAWDGRLYLVGGDDDFAPGNTSNQVNVYDIAAAAWVGSGTPMPYAVVRAGSAQAGPALYLAGGWADETPDHNVDRTQRYDIVDDSWEIGPAFLSARADMALAITGGALYAIGGDADGGSFFDLVASVERLDWAGWPAAAWSPAEPLPWAFGGQGGGFCTEDLAGGQVWSVGGFDAMGIAGTTWYAPAERCWGQDVPWLSAEPAGVLLLPGEQAAVQVTLDAGAPAVDQPGQYRAGLRLANDSPYPAPIVPITMTVPVPPTWGQLAGTVSSLGYCDVHTATMEGASVHIVDSTGQHWTLSTTYDGRYSRWLEQGPYTVTVGAEGQVTQTALVVVGAGLTATHDANLRLRAPCLEVAPGTVEVRLPVGTAAYTLSAGLVLSNSGAEELTFQLYPLSGTAGFVPRRAAPLQGDTSRPPEGYAPLPVQGAPQVDPLTGTVCVFMDLYPWGVTDTLAVLEAQGIPYQVYGSADLGTLDLDACGMIVISSDQPQSFYDAYAAQVARLEQYVYGGGFLNFFSCDMGYNGGLLHAPLPGGMTWTGMAWEGANVIDDPSHPVVQGVPNPFYGDLASHGYFGSLPAGAEVIAHGEMSGQPTIVTYRLGAGRLIAFGQPLEISHNWGWDAAPILENTLAWGYSDVPVARPSWFWTAPVSGTVPAGGSSRVELCFTTMPDGPLPLGTYRATLVVYHSDRTAGPVVVPVTMQVVLWGVYLPLVVK